jgi:hypothetical protein
MSKLAIILSLILLASPRVAAQQTKKLPPVPEFVNVPPEVAATHILKKVEPVYPAFARAVGMQGVVRIGIAVGTGGHLNATEGVISGWVCLGRAATNAVAQYRFRPFEKDGHPVVAETSVDIVFKLPDSKNVFDPPPPPRRPEGVRGFEKADSVTDISPELEKWVDSYLHASDASDFSQRALDSAVAVEIPTKDPKVRLYIVSEQATCGTGGCPIQLVEQSARGVRLLVAPDEVAGAFYAHFHEGSVYPDVFIEHRNGMVDSEITGYSEVGGEWVLLYCGKFSAGKGQVHVCR